VTGSPIGQLRVLVFADADPDHVSAAERAEHPGPWAGLLRVREQQLTDLADELRQAVEDTREPRLEALLDTSAQVLLGLAKSFAEHARRDEHRPP
jgi:hypothetical protein